MDEPLVHSLFPQRLPGEHIPALADLSEVKNMLSDRVEHWSQRWLEEGREEGIQKGREEGLEQGLEKGLEKGQRQKLAVFWPA